MENLYYLYFRGCSIEYFVIGHWFKATQWIRFSLNWFCTSKYFYLRFMGYLWDIMKISIDFLGYHGDISWEISNASWCDSQGFEFDAWRCLEDRRLEVPPWLLEIIPFFRLVEPKLSCLKPFILLFKSTISIYLTVIPKNIFWIQSQFFNP